MTVPTHRRVTLGAIAWVACVEFLVFQIITQSASSGLSMADHDISFLGIAGCRTFTDEVTGQPMPELCSPLHLWFNISLTLLGALMVIGLVLTRPLWPPGKATKAGQVFYAVGGLGAMAAGTFTVQTQIDIHMAGALLNFLLGSAGMILLSLALRERAPILARFGLAVGAIAAIGFMLYGVGAGFGLGRGGMERVGGYAAAAWPVVMGVGVFRNICVKPASLLH